MTATSTTVTSTSVGEDDRQRIVDAAWSVLQANGFDNLKVQAVIRRAKVSTGGFYRHFDGKDELVAALLEQELRRATRVLWECSRSGNPEQRVRAWLDSVVGLVYAHRGGPKARWIASIPESLHARTRLRATGHDCDTAEPLRDAIRAGIADRSFPHANVERDTAIILCLCDRLYQWGPDLLADTRSDAVAAVADFVIAALRSPNRP